MFSSIGSAVTGGGGTPVDATGGGSIPFAMRSSAHAGKRRKHKGGKARARAASKRKHKGR